MTNTEALEILVKEVKSINKKLEKLEGEVILLNDSVDEVLDILIEEQELVESILGIETDFEDEEDSCDCENCEFKGDCESDNEDEEDTGVEKSDLENLADGLCAFMKDITEDSAKKGKITSTEKDATMNYIDALSKLISTKKK